MLVSVFALGFDRDLWRTALEEPGLAARVLARSPKLDGADTAETVAGGRIARTRGRITGKLALRLAGALLDLGEWAEAIEVLEDPATDFVGREASHGESMARAYAAAGRIDDVRSCLTRLERIGASIETSPVAAALARAIAPGADADPAELAEQLCLLGAPQLALEILEPRLAGAEGEAMLESAFCLLRFLGKAEAVQLLEAMQPLYRAEGREASLRSTLAVLDGGPDAGVEPESKHSTVRQFLLRACLAEACAAARCWPAAIQRFDCVGKKWRDPDDGLLELARCVGRDLLDGVPVRLSGEDGPRKIFDLFPYNGESTMLQLKLGETSSWIERFVLVEADQTFPGRPKRLFFQDDPSAAAGPYAGRISPVVARRPPAHIDFTWAREFFQKDCSVLGLEGLGRPDDLVILSDADEMLDRAAIEGFDGDVACCEVRTFRFFLNCELVSAKLHVKTTVTRARQAAAHGWNYLRLGAIRYRRSRHLRNAGWHFSNIGGPEWLAYKMQCTAHEEWAGQDAAHFEKRLKRLRKAPMGDFVRREIDDSFPAGIRDKRDALAEFIL
jgi:beta-1,4-mannosyl-glycoprotein beta-1,4-N-acetylglucosaminyltransferase